MIAKRWVVAPTAPPEHLRRYEKINPLLAQILFNRGFEDPQDAYRFIYTKQLTLNPFDMKDMGKAVGRIRQAIKQGEAIVVYGDFDADGVTSTTLLMQVLNFLGANARPYIPHRIDEGYGLNTPALEALAQEGANLVITVDCGIRSVEEVAAGMAAGLDIIITDHHSIGPEIPAAYAVINPQQEDCPGESRLAGVGVAFMVARALMRASMQNGRKNQNGRFTADDLLDLVAIGTVADVMPLNCLENRVMVRRGLNVIKQSRRAGIKALLEVAGIKPDTVTTTSIGFGLGPRINAAGRLDSAMIAYELLSAKHEVDAAEYARTLQNLNKQRQDLTRSARDVIQEQLADKDPEDLALIFAGDESFQPGIVGLVAGRLAEEYYRPTVILEIGEGESRASCRSIPQFNITQALDERADLLVRHGGHAMAAGFTVANENIEALQVHLTASAEAALEGEILTRTIDVDLELDIQQLSEQLYTDLELLEPTGHENGQPVFLTRNAQVTDCRTVGSDDSHLKLKFSRTGHPPLDAIGFRLGEWAKKMEYAMDVVYTLEMNEWQGRRNLQMNVLDIRPAEAKT